MIHVFKGKVNEGDDDVGPYKRRLIGYFGGKGNPNLP